MINKELNNKVIELYEKLLREGVFRTQKAFCEMIDYEVPSFSHVIANRRSFPKSKIPVLVTKFDLPRDYFETYEGEDDVCSKIKHVRYIKKLKQREFAQELGVTQSAISAIENKTNREPSFNIIWGLINKMDVNPYFLFSDDQTVFDSRKRYNNRAKLDQAMSNIKKAVEDLNGLSL